MTLTTALVAVPLAAEPLPTGATVVQGGVGITTPTVNSMIVNQSTDRAIVNWQGFSIGQDARVDFVQPGVNSAILNRVTGTTGTEILGQLNANGQVFIVNPNGIFIGPNGKVQTGGAFVGSTLDTTDEDFANGRLVFRGTGQSGTVSNAGAITIGRGGYAALMGGKVRNSGTVLVPAGRVGFAAGEYVTLDVSGDQFMQVAVPSGDDGDGDALILNSGTVSAADGIIEMRAATAREAARNAINMSGVAEARSVTKRGGTVYLGGGDGGRVKVSGRVTTAATSDSPVDGGQITITGQDIALLNAAIDASGSANGGIIRIGGDLRGDGTLPHADTVFSDAATTIKADAGTDGDGGSIVLWSDKDTRVLGNTYARGGSASGNGGYIELSSVETLYYGGVADLRAANGVRGTLLLDPTDITIPGTMTEATLESNLASANVILDTSPAGPDTGNITINADIDWTSSSVLILLADNNIVLNGGLFGPNGGVQLRAVNTITTGSGGAVDVDRFYLQQGDWSQLGPVLPGFAANDFTFSPYQASFLRALGGDGTSGNPYQLTDVYGLQGISSGTSNFNSYVLANDIDASGVVNWDGGYGFAPIQNFSGNFDGGRFAITSLFQNTFNGEGYNRFGLFDTLDIYASVYDLSITGVNLTGDSGGVLAHTNNGRVYNVMTGGSVNSYGYYVGGLIGTNGGSIADSVTNVTLRVLLDNTFSSGSTFAGGLVGENSSAGSINRSSALGSVAVINSQSYFTAEIGGAIGSNSGTVADSYAMGDVSVDFGSATDSAVYAGGFAGTASTDIQRSFSSGAVMASGVGSPSVGGFLGGDFTSGGDFSTNFWDTVTSGQASSAGGTGLTTAQFQDTNAFYLLGMAAGWDFLNVWAPGDTGYYPVNFSTSQAVFAIPNDETSEYGQFASLMASASLYGGSLAYVFDDPADTLDEPGFTPTFGLGGITVGTQDLNLLNTTINSVLGRSFRIVALTASVDITPAPLTITADDQFKTYGDLFTFVGDEFTTVGLVYSDTVTSATLTSAGAVATAGITTDLPYAIAISNAVGTGLSNYTITYVVGGMTVNPAPLTITADDQTKTYGDIFTFAGDEFTVVGLRNADTVSSATLTSAGSTGTATVAGGPYDIVASAAQGSGLSNYTITYVDGAMTVTPAALTITADDQSKVYGDTFAFLGDEFTVLGLLNLDAVDSVTLTSTGTAATATVADSPHAIVASNAMGSGLSNYTITYVDGGLTVTPAALTITALNQSKIYGVAFTFAGTEITATGLLNADTVTGATLTSAGTAATATVAGGPYAILASAATGSGLGNYTITYTDGAMTVTPAALTVTADDQTKLQGEEFLFDGTEFTTAGLVNTDTVDSAMISSTGAPSTATPDGSPYAIDIAGASGSGLDNYTITYVSGSMTVSPVTAPPPPVMVPPPPNPPDDPPPVFVGGGEPEGSPTVAGNPPGPGTDVLKIVEDTATTLEVAAQGCAQSDADVTRYLACLSDALNDFANELDKLSTELPPGMENIASIVQDARRSIDASSARAAARLAGATTDAQRAGIRTDAINEARGAIATASAEIRKTISLVRADDPELASLQRATITRVAEAVDSVGIELSRAVGL